MSRDCDVINFWIYIAANNNSNLILHACCRVSMAKDRTVNPATAALKAAKKRDIKKGRANVEKQRAERFAKRNPFRIQQQIDELKHAQESGSLRPKDKQLLDSLEKEHKAILRAREQLGDAAPTFRAPRQDRDGDSVLGKRRRDSNNNSRRNSESETDDDVKTISMPKDVENMPPAPRRRPQPNSSNTDKVDLSLPKKPEVQSQAVYESAPVIKDLRKEAIKAFVPTSVSRNIKQTRQTDRRPEGPSNVDGLKTAAYVDAAAAADAAAKEAEYGMMAKDTDDLYTEDVVAERQLQHVGSLSGERAEDLEAESHFDAGMAAEEAIKEAEYAMMTKELEEGYSGNAKREGEVAERQLRRVEIEEVDDDDG